MGRRPTAGYTGRGVTIEANHIPQRRVLYVACTAWRAQIREAHLAARMPGEEGHQLLEWIRTSVACAGYYPMVAHSDR